MPDQLAKNSKRWYSLIIIASGFLILHNSSIKMSLSAGKVFSPVHKVSLLLMVYALHLFLFLGLTAFSITSFTNLNGGHTSGKSGMQHDPASVECRSLFKYDDSKQHIDLDHIPVVTPLHANIYRPYRANVSGTDLPVANPLSGESNKRYSLFGVFLI